MAAEPLAEGGAAGTAAAGGGGRLGMQFAGKQAEKEETQVIFLPIRTCAISGNLTRN